MILVMPIYRNQFVIWCTVIGKVVIYVNMQIEIAPNSLKYRVKLKNTPELKANQSYKSLRIATKECKNNLI